jgi:hypothetical protein
LTGITLIRETILGHFELLRLPLRDIRWWGGLAAAASFGLQAIALVLGSVVLVQALQATAPLACGAARRERHRVSMETGGKRPV